MAGQTAGTCQRLTHPPSHRGVGPGGFFNSLCSERGRCASEPFRFHGNEVQYNFYIEQLDLLDAVLSQKDEVRIRKKNADIERFITEKNELIAIAVSIGKHLDSYASLETQHQRLAILSKALASLAKSPATVTTAELETISASGSSVDENVAKSIDDRDALLKLLDGKSKKIVELNQIRNNLLVKHSEAFGEDGSHCALCGLDWQTAEKLKQAITDTSAVYQSEIGSLSGKLQEHYQLISKSLDPIKFSLTSEIADLERIFKRVLHTELGKNLNSFGELKKLNERLSKQGIDYSAEFTSDFVELTSREAKLVVQIRALKEMEGETPPMGWDQAISNTFAKIEDFHTATVEHFAEKRRYITTKHRLQQNTALQSAKQDQNKRQLAFNAAVAAKEKVSTLKALLTATERDYSARVISNIELIFHIYSGRLIQNYQRGLGLFIDYGDGKQLQFCTAEQSAHDATLSMSSGQLSALSLSFFLSLNRVYAESAFVLIDDPAQSLDEINIASLTDLLRCELSDRQLLISSHEDNIAGYMRYRFNRAGLSQKPFHMQSHVEEAKIA